MRAAALACLVGCCHEWVLWWAVMSAATVRVVAVAASSFAHLSTLGGRDG